MMIRMLSMFISLAFLFVMLYAGKLLSILIPIGIPDSIWGMLLLFSCLVIGIVKVEWITPSARPLTRYMTVFFIPICAEIIQHLDMLQQHFTSFVFANILSTLVSLALIGLFAQWMFHRK
ncbi:CidA/LrgA family protein [Actinobacillus vicugnae]|uniref:CidA/LrgA family protein n=1 Tax=Actinobacillus vicugnae TaxID=2573093 RepID=UPI0012420122|nr:CidA/LrgA family protein [Actinobacillus vicugnae]